MVKSSLVSRCLRANEKKKKIKRAKKRASIIPQFRGMCVVGRGVWGEGVPPKKTACLRSWLLRQNFKCGIICGS